MLGPAILDLEQLSRWLKTVAAAREPLSSVVAQALAAARCHSSGTEAVYVDYLSELEQGRHLPALLENLALPNLQLAPTVLLAWRESLRRLGPPPEGLDRLVLECLAVVQPMQQLRQSERQSLRDPVTGLPDRGGLPYLLQQARLQTEAPRCVAFLYVEVLLGGRLGGDALLHAVAGRLAKVLRERDVLLQVERQIFGLLLVNLNGEGHALLRRIGSRPVLNSRSCSKPGPCNWGCASASCWCRSMARPRNRSCPPGRWRRGGMPKKASGCMTRSATG